MGSLSFFFSRKPQVGDKRMQLSNLRTPIGMQAALNFENRAHPVHIQGDRRFPKFQRQIEALCVKPASF